MFKKIKYIVKAKGRFKRSEKSLRNIDALRKKAFINDERGSSMFSKKSYENIQKNIRNLDLPKIECWENQYSDKDYSVFLKSSELTCICPKTGLPDFGSLFLSYVPDKYCLELKSFKLYLHAYRNVGIFHEHIANKILEDIVDSCYPRSDHLKLKIKTRGGIRSSVEVFFPQQHSKKTTI